ncbi:hypothetical protein A9Q73_03670 [Bermanella sp. 47_1433_sub80_T6]|nr:hypothetical protein A9Q73_03670 [Bermanella sp. 47_1433_sub80_T6]
MGEIYPMNQVSAIGESLDGGIHMGIYLGVLHAKIVRVMIVRNTVVQRRRRLLVGCGSHATQGW